MLDGNVWTVVHHTHFEKNRYYLESPHERNLLYVRSYVITREVLLEDFIQMTRIHCIVSTDGENYTS